MYYFNIFSGGNRSCLGFSLFTDGTTSTSMGWERISSPYLMSSAPLGVKMSTTWEAGGAARMVGSANGAG